MTRGCLPPASASRGRGPVDLPTLAAGVRRVFVTAAVTTENRGFLGAEAFASMRRAPA